MTYWKLQGQIHDPVFYTGLTVYSRLLFQPEFSLFFIFFLGFPLLVWVFIILFVFIMSLNVFDINLFAQKMNLVWKWTLFELNSDNALMVSGEKMRHEPSLTFLKRLQYSVEKLGDLKNVKQLSLPSLGQQNFLISFDRVSWLYLLYCWEIVAEFSISQYLYILVNQCISFIKKQ